MTAGQNIWRVCGPANPVADILFIHGLTGDPQATWTSANPQREYWPSWFCDEFSDVAVYTLGYPASIIEKWAKQEINLHERANNMLEQLASFGNRRTTNRNRGS